MRLDYDRLMALDSPEQRHDYTDRDTMLYALSVGVGHDPLDPRQLRFVYEKKLLAMPAMAHVLAMNTDWIFDSANGLDVPKLLHFESGLSMSGILPVAGAVIGKVRIRDIFDRGVDKGALLKFEQSLRDAGTGEPIGTVTGTFLLRGNGGFGGAPPEHAVPEPFPDRAPDAVCDLPTLPQSALLYRLNLDRNPIHVDPDVARTAGFERPLLHGSCTYGVGSHAFLRSLCDYDPARLKTFDLRFSAPVFPGETIRTEFWEVAPRRYRFRSTSLERGAVVLDNGLAEQH